MGDAFEAAPKADAQKLMHVERFDVFYGENFLKDRKEREERERERNIGKERGRDSSLYLIRVILRAKTPIEPLETEELIQKFMRPKEDLFGQLSMVRLDL